MDISKHENLSKSKTLLQTLVQNQIGSKPILVVGHKCDLVPALDKQKMIDKMCTEMDLFSILKKRKWGVKLATSLIGEGLEECLDWLVDLGRQNMFSANSQIAPYLLQNMSLAFDEITRTE